VSTHYHGERPDESRVLVGVHTREATGFVFTWNIDPCLEFDTIRVALDPDEDESRTSPLDEWIPFMNSADWLGRAFSWRYAIGQLS
jgi:hypothetical protein